MNKTATLLPEWFPQEAVILAWPDEKTDWQPWLKEVRNTYRQIIEAITANQTGVILLVHPGQISAVYELLRSTKNLLIVSANYNDTWCRDYCFLTRSNGTELLPLEYQFNGWGNKFDASNDNQINLNVFQEMCKHSIETRATVAEGGALEIDQHGHLLSTELCLKNPQRNGNLSLVQYCQQFADDLGASKVSILQHGHLEGDDTDGHIDTLVRFAPSGSLVIQSCFNRPEDAHFDGLNRLVDECQSLFDHHQIFQLPLPLVLNQQGERLPASYANFLITNQQVLVPIYQQPEDEEALQIIQQAFPEFNIIPIDSLSLIQQFGSVHCITMQVPEGTLKASVTQLFEHQANVWEADNDE